MSSGVSELEARIARLKQKKTDLSRATKRAQQHVRRGAKKAEVAQLLEQSGANEVCPKLEQGASKVLLLLLELANFCNDIVVSYVLGEGRPEQVRAHGLNTSDTDTRWRISTGVDLLYLGVTYSLVLGLQEAAERDVHSLCMYILEYRLFHWLVQQNCEKGVYPRASQIFAQACSFLPSGAPYHLQQRMRAFFCAGDRATRYWLVTFKQRWGVKVGLPPAGEDLEPGQLECKVSWLGSLQ